MSERCKHWTAYMMVLRYIHATPLDAKRVEGFD